MKSAKKILALILAGVMALALLTGCGKSTSLNRTMAEGIADYFKSSCVQVGNKNNISLSYQVPELNRDIAPCLMKTGSPMMTARGVIPLQAAPWSTVRPSERL